MLHSCLTSTDLVRTVSFVIKLFITVMFNFHWSGSYCYLQCIASLDTQQHSHVGIHQSRGDIVLQPDIDNSHMSGSSQGHMYSFHILRQMKGISEYTRHLSYISWLGNWCKIGCSILVQFIFNVFNDVFSNQEQIKPFVLDR